MNLRCGFCQNPYTLGRTEILAALQHLESENLTHYDALRQKLEMAMPNWKAELKEAVKQPAPEPIEPAQPQAEKPAKKAAPAKAPAKKSSGTSRKRSK
jgi:hypothetical protein